MGIGGVMKIRAIGDAHGHMDKYVPITVGVEHSILLGDIGFGFGIDIPILEPTHRMIRGNHDSPAEFKLHPNHIDDGTIEKIKEKDEEISVMYIGGAWSVDWEWRQQRMAHGGKAIWWKDEECSVREFNRMIEAYEENHPTIMFTHDCPTMAANALDSHHSWDNFKTRTAFDSMWEIHKPEMWIFGHHHMSKAMDIQGTRFICLDELAYIDIELGE